VWSFADAKLQNQTADCQRKKSLSTVGFCQQGVAYFIGAFEDAVYERFEHVFYVAQVYGHAFCLQTAFDLVEFPRQNGDERDADADHKAGIARVDVKDF
jgi:hypothetical protein